MGMNARPVHDMKRPGEFVLMDGGRSVQPEQELDVKPRVAVDDELRLAERRIGLKRAALRRAGNRA